MAPRKSPSAPEARDLLHSQSLKIVEGLLRHEISAQTLQLEQLLVTTRHAVHEVLEARLFSAQRFQEISALENLRLAEHRAQPGQDELVRADQDASSREKRALVARACNRD